MTQRFEILIFVLAVTAAAQPITEIALPGKRVFPESITSISDGTLIIGSLGFGNVSRIAPGKTTAEEWIKPGTGGLNQVLGVYAEEKSKTLWVCSNNLQGKGEATAAAPVSPEEDAPTRVEAMRAKIKAGGHESPYWAAERRCQIRAGSNRQAQSW